MAFVVSCCRLFLFVGVCSYLLVFVASCRCGLLVVGVSCYLLVFVISFWCLLLVVGGCDSKVNNETDGDKATDNEQ